MEKVIQGLELKGWERRLLYVVTTIRQFGAVRRAFTRAFAAREDGGQGITLVEALELAGPDGQVRERMVLTRQVVQ